MPTVADRRRQPHAAPHRHHGPGAGRVHASWPPRTASRRCRPCSAPSPTRWSSTSRCRGVSGYVAARLLKDDWQTAEIPVVLLTSLDAACDRYWGEQTGADRFLTKDFEAPQLVAAIAEVHRGRRRARAAAARRCGPTRSSSATTRCWPGSPSCSTASCSRPRSPPRSPASPPTCTASRRRSPRCSACSAGSSTTTWRPSACSTTALTYLTVARDDLAAAVHRVLRRDRRRRAPR